MSHSLKCRRYGLEECRLVGVGVRHDREARVHVAILSDPLGLCAGVAVLKGDLVGRIAARALYALDALYALLALQAALAFVSLVAFVTVVALVAALALLVFLLFIGIRGLYRATAVQTDTGTKTVEKPITTPVKD